MGEPFSNPSDGWEIGAKPDRSQVSAFRNAADAPATQVQHYCAQVMNLRGYTRKMKGVMLDASA
jgi:hypothetical protein